MSFYKEITILQNTLDYENNLLVYILLCLLNLSWANARNKQQEAEALIKKSVEALYNNPKQASYYAAKVIELFPEERQMIKSRSNVLLQSGRKAIRQF